MYYSVKIFILCQSNSFIQYFYINQQNTSHMQCVEEFNLGLLWFYGISTIVGYLIPNPVYTYILDRYDL